MFDDLLRLEAQGFSRVSTAIAFRSVATCPNLLLRPYSRPVIGVAILSVVPDPEGGFHFQSQATALRDDALPASLADWIEVRLPVTGPIISWEPDDSFEAKMRGILDGARHPGLTQLLAESKERLRVLPRWVMGRFRRGVAPGVPCFCSCSAECVPELPSVFLPDPAQTERELIGEAEVAWAMWADLHATVDDETHPARVALRILAERQRARGAFPIR
ncbi:hypothetical protein [Sphingomonas sp. 22176]|uniref:hypothetical protein n=1 Tax=Sphingomonas sp. 22176 TaxID=3453884 RepID=UPI003F824886